MPDVEILKSGLPPSLCRHCVFGSCVVMIRPADPDEKEFLPDGTAGIEIERSFCRSPHFIGASRDAEPLEMDHPVRECEAFLAEEWARKAEAAEAKKQQTRRAKRRGRKGR